MELYRLDLINKALNIHPIDSGQKQETRTKKNSLQKYQTIRSETLKKPDHLCYFFFLSKCIFFALAAHFTSNFLDENYILIF